MIDALDRIGYRAHPFEAGRAESDEARQARWLMRCLAVAGFAAMNIMLLSVAVWSGSSDMTPETRDLFHWLSALIALPAAAYAGQPFFRSAWNDPRRGRINMDVPISLGVTLAVGMSVIETINHAHHAYFDSAIMLLFFLLCGRYLDHAMRRKTRAVAGNLAALKAEVAHRFENERRDRASCRPCCSEARRPAARASGRAHRGRRGRDLRRVGDRREPGHRRNRTAGGRGGRLGLRRQPEFLRRPDRPSDRRRRGTLIDEVERLLEKAVAVRSPAICGWPTAPRAFMPRFVHATAALTAIGWLLAGASVHDAVVTAIAVLIITCPCALALAIPAVQVVASGAMFRGGVILNAAMPSSGSPRSIPSSSTRPAP